MASEVGAPPPNPPVVGASSSEFAIPLDALSVVLESLFSQVDVACGCKVGKKHPLPSPSSGENSEPEVGPCRSRSTVPRVLR